MAQKKSIKPKLVQSKSSKKTFISHLSEAKKTVIKFVKKIISKIRSSVASIAVIIFAFLFTISALMLFMQSQKASDKLIVQDVKRLKQIIMKIDQDCKIIGFEHTKNYIDFLTVKDFVGSEVGAMNLAYPQNWQGPYLKDNPTVQQQQYIILKNKKGHYLVPGDGVVLANGKKIGTDIILNADTNIEKLAQDPNGLKSPEGVLAVSLDIGKNFLQKMMHKPLVYA